MHIESVCLTVAQTNPSFKHSDMRKMPMPITHTTHPHAHTHNTCTYILYTHNAHNTNAHIHTYTCIATDKSNFKKPGVHQI